MFLPYTREMEDEWYANLQKRKDLISFAIIILEEEHHEKLIGKCGVTINWKNRCGGLGIVIGEKNYWGRGYGTRALGLLIEYCFNTLNLYRVELEVLEFNKRAIKVYQKCGFKEEGRRRQAHYSKGSYHDKILMGLLKDEWSKGEMKYTIEGVNSLKKLEYRIKNSDERNLKEVSLDV